MKKGLLIIALLALSSTVKAQVLDTLYYNSRGAEVAFATFATSLMYKYTDNTDSANNSFKNVDIKTGQTTLEGSFVMDGEVFLKNGIIVKYDETGKEIEQANYKKGVLHGKCITMPLSDKSIIINTNYNNGELNGIQTSKVDGKMSTYETYEKGIKQGLFVDYDDNGVMCRIGASANGNIEGDVREYDNEKFVTYFYDYIAGVKQDDEFYAKVESGQKLKYTNTANGISLSEELPIQKKGGVVEIDGVRYVVEVSIVDEYGKHYRIDVLTSNSTLLDGKLSSKDVIISRYDRATGFMKNVKKVDFQTYNKRVNRNANARRFFGGMGDVMISLVYAMAPAPTQNATVDTDYYDGYKYVGSTTTNISVVDQAQQAENMAQMNQALEESWIAREELIAKRRAEFEDVADEYISTDGVVIECAVLQNFHLLAEYKDADKVGVTIKIKGVNYDWVFEKDDIKNVIEEEKLNKKMVKDRG